jgi:exopolyphosphatase/guanosine-5'-triphosphate,3'-diphosphate pyrophosphatase
MGAMHRGGSEACRPALFSKMPILAAVDIGSNSVRLKIAELQPVSSTSASAPRRLRVLHEDREVTRLGESAFDKGALSPDAMERTLKALRRFRKATGRFEADAVRVVATSAVRDARNAEEFLSWVHAVTGWRVEIISGLEEGRLIHLGVVSASRLAADRLLVVDLGGGSCELIFSRRGNIVRMLSLPLGAVRLTQQFLQHDPPTKIELQRLREYIEEEISGAGRELARAKVEAAIATSGTAAALAAALHDSSAAPPGARVTLPALSRLARRLVKLTRRERNAIPGIGTRRAEIIVAGAVVIEQLMSDCGLKAFRYSPLGLRDGLLVQMAAEIGQDRLLRQRLESQRWQAVEETAQRYGVDPSYGQHVRRLVERLFTELAPVHRLPPEYRGWLAAAALLHDAGAYIARSGRHRHARYIVANTEMIGFSPRERLVIASLARYLGKSRPTPDDPIVRSLPHAYRSGIPAAVILLRMAAALNLSRRGAVRNVRVAIGQRQVRLSLVTAPGGATLEIWALERERAYFREVFGRDLAVRAAGAESAGSASRAISRAPSRSRGRAPKPSRKLSRRPA